MVQSHMYFASPLTIQYNTYTYAINIQYNAIQYNAIQCNTMQYNAIQYIYICKCNTYTINANYYKTSIEKQSQNEKKLEQSDLSQGDEYIPYLCIKH